MTAGACIGCGANLGFGRFCPECGLEQPAPAVDPFLGRVLAERYEIVELLQAGGMGRVYRARHRSLDRAVAVKLIHPELLSAADVVARFTVEARTMSRLSHPNVAAVHDFGQLSEADGGHLFLVMELVEGEDLCTVLAREDPLPLRRVGHIVDQMLRALGEAHELGIIHRDVKPDNILLQRTRRGTDHVKLIDFGVAQAATLKGRRITRAGQAVGTPVYMAPEQARGDEATAVADLYAVGVTLFEMLAGRPPFDASTLQALLLAHSHAERPDPRLAARERHITPEMAHVTMRAMAVEPRARYASADDMAEALAEALVASGEAATAGVASGLPGTSSPPRPFGPSSSRARTSAPGAVPSIGPSSTASPTPVSSPPRISDPGPSSPAPRPVLALPATPGAPPPAPPPSSPVASVAAFARTMPSIPIPVRATITSSGAADEAALLGRADDLAWVAHTLDDPDARAIVVEAPAGFGRTRMWRELSVLASTRGALVEHVRVAPMPRSLQSRRGLREIVARLTRSDIAVLAQGAGSDSPLVVEGLRAIFEPNVSWQRGSGSAPTSEPPTDPDAGEFARRAAGEALAWAAEVAVVRAHDKGCPAGVALCIDDLDALDGVSRNALADVLAGDPPSGFCVIGTSDGLPGGLMGPGARVRELTGLTLDQASTLLAGAPVMRSLLERATSPGGRLSPLYLELCARPEVAARFLTEPPPNLEAAAGALLDALPPAERQVMWAIAVTGGGALGRVQSVAAVEHGFLEAVGALCERGICELERGQSSVRARHVVFSAVAEATAALAGEREPLHGRAADGLGGDPAYVELRAYHSASAGRELQAIVLLETAARLRQAAGDLAGSVTSLSQALGLARGRALAGEAEGFAALGRKLATALLDSGELTGAQAVLDEVDGLLEPESPQRALVLERLSLLAARRNLPNDAARLWMEALTLAQRGGDPEVPEGLFAARHGSERRSTPGAAPSAGGRRD